VSDVQQFMDFVNGLKELGRQRREALQPFNKRRLLLIEEMEKNNGQLSEEKLAELRDLQKKFGLPSDF